jgi:ectoine hydroxylase-related dioxygenase (phytanoyl-CoA dioxygenase family)
MWHSDNGRIELPYETLKTAIYLDPVGPDTGCLRVIPGSHRSRLHEDLRSMRDDSSWSQVPEREIPSVALASEPGDVVFFNHRTYHASFGGSVGRRMFTMNFAAAPTTREAKEHLRQVYEFNINEQRTIMGGDDVRIYDDAFLHSEHPRLQQLAEPLIAMGLR